MRCPLALLLNSLLVGGLSAQTFTNFESPQVHPLELSADGQRLYVVNTPDNRVGIYGLTDPRRPVLLREVFVGLEPVSVRERTADEIWVVGYLADAVSIVAVPTGTVTAVLSVSDEPTDVVFAGGKAFVSVSGSDEVVVFDAATRRRLGAIPIFGDEPRSLVVSADERTVWTVVHRSGNGTTALKPAVAPPQPRPTNRRLPKPPQVALIVDSEDPTHRGKHDVVLPDFDLVELDVRTETVRRSYREVGTINFGAALRPGTNEVWVANTEARNLVRFTTNLRGHAVDNRVTRVQTGASASVTPIDLNPGIDYSVLPNNAALGTALAQPTDVVWNAAGTRMYVAGFGTDRVGVLDANGRVTGRIEVGGTPGAGVDSRNKRGPRALALHDGAGLLYVLNRLSNSLTAIDVARRSVLWELGLPDPTPAAIKQGRGFLYDAKLSGNGTFACAACHVDGDIDGLAWDLGDPGGNMVRVRGFNGFLDMHPMKGPMTTQTFKGMKGTGALHWRGDKAGLVDFNSTFDALMGKTQLSAADMASFVTFMESIAYGSNPNRNLDDSLASQAARDGAAIYSNVPFTATITCATCHSLPLGTNGSIIPANLIGGTQGMKTPQLRNIYKKLGHRKTAAGRKAGFGLLHDGVDVDVFDLLGKSVFGSFANNPTIKSKLGAFVEAFDTGTARTVGHQVRVDQAGLAGVLADVALLRDRAESGACNLILTGELDGVARSFFYRAGSRDFQPDTTAMQPVGWSFLEAKVRAGAASFLAVGVPRGSGPRMGLDRDGDGVFDGDDGIELYGTATAGCAGPPRIGASSEPRIGNEWFSVVAGNAPTRAQGIFGLATRKARFPLLGVDVLVAIGSPGSLYLTVAADGRGDFGLALPVPHQQSLVGLQVFTQVLFVDRCGPQGLSATRGLGLRVTAR